MPYIQICVFHMCALLAFAFSFDFYSINAACETNAIVPFHATQPFDSCRLERFGARAGITRFVSFELCAFLFCVILSNDAR